MNRQSELLAFRHALRDRRCQEALDSAVVTYWNLEQRGHHRLSICQGEAEAALTTKLHRQFRAGDNGPHAFWSIYHKDGNSSAKCIVGISREQEDSKWMLPAPSSIASPG